jgi:uncharacterized protein
VSATAGADDRPERQVTHNPWLVPVTTLRRQPGARREERRVGRIGELSVAGSVVPASAEAVAQAVLDSAVGAIEVTAEIRAPWQGECRRCLRPLIGELRCEVRELYRSRHEQEQPDPDEDTYPLEGDHLDLSPLVRDALLLELPLAPLCREDCRGLCSMCGADLNAGPCGCSSSTGDPRWGALDVLRVSDGDGG